MAGKESSIEIGQNLDGMVRISQYAQKVIGPKYLMIRFV
jgi:hypothetical protein